MTNCPSWEALNALIDGELSTPRELQSWWHLDLCGTCARDAAGVLALKRAVGRVRERNVPSPALRRNVMTRVPI